MAAEVEFFGETFRLTSDVSEFALMEFAEAASGGVDGDSMSGMAALLRLIMECLGDETDSDATAAQRARFRSVARKNRATAADLVPVIDAAFNAVAERPTGRSSDSSDGPRRTEPKSESSTSGKVAELFPGRPDMQLALLRTTTEAAAV